MTRSSRASSFVDERSKEDRILAKGVLVTVEALVGKVDLVTAAERVIVAVQVNSAVAARERSSVAVAQVASEGHQAIVAALFKALTAAAVPRAAPAIAAARVGGALAVVEAPGAGVAGEVEEGDGGDKE